MSQPPKEFLDNRIRYFVSLFFSPSDAKTFKMEDFPILLKPFTVTMG